MIVKIIFEDLTCLDRLFASSYNQHRCPRSENPENLKFSFRYNNYSAPVRFAGIVAELRWSNQRISISNLEVRSDLYMTDRPPAASDNASNDNDPDGVIAGLARDLRVPLNSILGFSQWLATDSSRILTEDQREAVAQIMEAARQLNQMIEATMSPDTGASNILQIDDATIDIADVVARAIEMVTPMAMRSNVRISNDLDKDSQLAIRGDSARLLQLIFNLLSNAVKFNKPDGTVVVRAGHSSDGMLRIEVEDSGIGIAEDQRAAIFDPLRPTVSSNSAGGGAGMGLAIARRLCELMKGRIGFDSVVGKGSKFWIDLPPPDGTEQSATELGATKLSDEDQGATTASKADTIDTPSSSTGSVQKILYIEDNPANVRLLEFLIERHENLQLLTAVNAEDGIEMAFADPPDLILMDIGLPGMDGFQALKVLRGDARTATLPVMAVSANAMRHDVERGQQAGFADYLTKPIVIDDFLTAIKRILPAS